ncbi:Endonuclease 2 [Citrus sinensis]|nr:Endonuclease 2 [Citrus sinensis]
MLCFQSRLSEAAADAVKQLLPESADNDLGSVCTWADHVKFHYHWSSALHFIDTPDNLCTYQYNRDCKDEDGVKGRCVAGAINNYTTQLLSYNSASSSHSEYNLTEALLFLSHFIGDIHQPLHVGFTSDRGGNTIDVHWYTRKQVLHHVWDNNIIETAEERYASEGIKAACDWAYKGKELADEYFNSRLPIVKLRLAQGGVRLAATLNRIFG